MSRLTGKVEVQLLINARGDVQKASLINGPLLLGGAALAAVRGWKYYPAQRGGIPTDSEETVAFIFKLN